jgi:hypothetical protein
MISTNFFPNEPVPPVTRAFLFVLEIFVLQIKENGLKR